MRGGGGGGGKQGPPPSAGGGGEPRRTGRWLKKPTKQIWNRDLPRDVPPPPPHPSRITESELKKKPRKGKDSENLKQQNRILPFHCQRKPTQQHAPTTPSYAPPTITQPLSTTCPQPLPPPAHTHLPPLHRHRHPECRRHERRIPTQKRTQNLYDQKTRHTLHRLPCSN